MPSVLSRLIRAVVAPALATAVFSACAGHPGGAHTAAAPVATVDWSAVDAAMGRASVAQSDNVHRFNMPRSDLRVTVDGVVLRPSFALGSWLAMKPVADGVMAMGDLVLTADEIEPVLTRLQAGGIEQTAIHHHVIRESPRVLYVHVHGHGNPVAIARAVHDAVALTATPPAAAPASATVVAFPLDTIALVRALGYAGRVNGGVYQVTVPRTEVIRDGGVVIPAIMGLGTAINFQPTGDGKAAITGDFVLTAAEVNPVIRALRDGGIEVTSLHNHLLNDEPRLFFMHFWANDDAIRLAQVLRGALARTASAPSTIR
ncbi:MAG: DUF1259 domain-containing protein [Gemmatimonadaceae bacterium]|nr:DUF1259 domain-containing protein [Gemmatimonadaceae bacterium]